MNNRTEIDTIYDVIINDDPRITDWDASETAHNILDALAAAGFAVVRPDEEQWGIELDDDGSTDMYPCEAEARAAATNGETLVRVLLVRHDEEAGR